MASVQAPLTDAEFTSAVELLQRIIPKDDFSAYSLDVSPATVYTTLVTLWMLTLQRLGGGKSMTCIIKDVLTNHRDLLPDNKRVREGTLSERSGSYSARSEAITDQDRPGLRRACQRLPDREVPPVVHRPTRVHH